MKSQNDYIIFTDGGSRGNPGEAAYGFAVYNHELKEIYREGKRIGLTTNNIAEYKGVIEALKWVENNLKETCAVIKIHLDSLLVVSQLNGLYKVKNENMRNYFFTVKELEKNIKGKISYIAVPREKNKIADRLVNLALDGKLEF